MAVHKVSYYVYVWATSLDKAIIELHRGNYYWFKWIAKKHKLTGLRLWTIKFTVKHD